MIRNIFFWLRAAIAYRCFDMPLNPLIPNRKIFLSSSFRKNISYFAYENVVRVLCVIKCDSNANASALFSAMCALDVSDVPGRKRLHIILSHAFMNIRMLSRNMGTRTKIEHQLTRQKVCAGDPQVFAVMSSASHLKYKICNCFSYRHRRCRCRSFCCASFWERSALTTTAENELERLSCCYFINSFMSLITIQFTQRRCWCFCLLLLFLHMLRYLLKRCRFVRFHFSSLSNFRVNYLLMWRIVH